MEFMVEHWLEGSSSLLVDGNNVMGSRPDGWWRDRPAASARLVAQLGTLAAACDLAITVVFDGVAPSPAPAAPAGVEVRYAERGGPDAADDVIAALVAADAAAVTVVTADGALRRRVEAAGGAVMGPAALLAAFEEVSA